MELCPFLSYEHPVRFAHRGSRVLWPENTMTAFQGAVDLGYRYIETDVHVSRDGVIFIFHDDTLERVTNGKGLARDWEWAELKKLDAAYRFKPEAGYPLRNKGIHIPCLEEVMAAFPDMMFNIDLKQPGIEALMADFISSHGYGERVLIASFKDRRLRRFRKLAGEGIATSAGLREAGVFWAYSRLNKILETPAQALQVPVRMRGVTVVDKKMIAAAHAAGKQVHVWTVNDPEEMQRLLNLGIDGIVTDRPDLLK